MVSLRRRVAVVCALCLFIVVTAAVAAAPQFITVDVKGASQTYLYGINPSGDMVGAYVAGVEEHGLIVRSGVVETFDYPGATATECYGINPQGDVVGQYVRFSDKTVQGFLLPAGSSDAVPIHVEQAADLGPANTMPFRISPEGVIVGCLHQTTDAPYLTMHGFMIDANGATSDPLVGSMYTGVNASGAVTGHYYSSGITLESFVLKNGVLTWFTYPGAAITRAYDINTNGDIVGFYRKDWKSPFHGFLYSHGKMSSIDVPFSGAKNTRAFGISPTGDIVGFYQDATGIHGFLRTHRGSE